MMIIKWIKHEINIQRVNGLYSVYIIVNLVYIFLLGYVPERYIDLATSIIIFSDPTMIGMVFVGAFILLEKRNNVTKGIGISPLGAKGYVIGKVISMWVIAVITSLVIASVYKVRTFNVVGLITSISIGSAIFTCIGIIVGAYVKSMNQYLVVIIIASIILVIPIFSLIGLNFISLSIIPTGSIFSMIAISIVGGDILIWDILISLAWMFGMFIITEKVVQNKLFRG